MSAVALLVFASTAEIAGVCFLYAEKNVCISPFVIDRTEVTIDAYDECVAAGMCTRPPCQVRKNASGDYPVTCVSWHEAKQYCEWRQMRLPTEAEWELAARGKDRRYPWGDLAPTCERSANQGCANAPSPVATHPKGDTPEGVSDLSGNVFEWVQDWFAEKRKPRARDPKGPCDGKMSCPSLRYRVVKGGATDAVAILLDPKERYFIYPKNNKLNFVGFRCANSQ